MQQSFEHASEDILEGYSLGTLAEADAGLFEDHLLVCPECQDRLGETDTYVRAMRHATAGLRHQRAMAWNDRLPETPGFVAFPRLAWVFASLLLVVGLMWLSGTWTRSRFPSMPPVAVALQTLRGGDGSAVATAPRDRALVLEADVSSLPARGELELRVVDAGGRLVGAYAAQPKGTRVTAPVSKGLAQGAYWVRLYATNLGDNLLREYALLVK